MKPGILTLTTDFGIGGPYVAAMKGVVLGLAPGTQIVDVCHTIAPQNILEGAFVLAGIVDAFPAGTVHLVVIDPGVGTDRRLVAARLADQWFVLPDNGLITGVARNQPLQGIWEITNPAIRRPVVSDTFHGRDILAPAAAHLLRGGDPAELGAPLSEVDHPAQLRAHARRYELCGRGDLPRHLRQPDHQRERSPPGRSSGRRLGRRDRRGTDRGPVAHLRRKAHGLADGPGRAAPAGSRSPSSTATRPGSSPPVRGRPSG